MSEKLDELFKEFENVFVARGQEIKDYLLKYKKEDFQTRDVIDVRRRDATERLKTSGFRKNLSMWQNFYKNVIVSSCVEIEGEEKRFDYKFYFTQEKIDSDLLEEVEEMIRDANKLNARMHFKDALEKVDTIENMVKDKEDEYFNEQLRILRNNIKESRKEYNEKLQKIDELKSDLKAAQESKTFDKALTKGRKIVEIAKSIRKRKIQKEFESILKELNREKVNQEISDLEQEIKKNKELERYAIAKNNCKKVIALATSIENKEIKEKYQREIENIEKNIQNLKENQTLTNKIHALEEELEKKREQSEYKESLEIVVELIQLASLLEDEENWENYTELKNELIFELDEKKKQQREKEKKTELQELEKALWERQEQDDLRGVINFAEEIIAIASEINNQEKVNQYQSLINQGKEKIKERRETKQFQEELNQIRADLKKNQKHENWEKALKNCRDILYLSRERNKENIIKKYRKVKEDIKAKLVQKKQTSTLSKKYSFNWDFNSQEPILTCSVVRRREQIFLVYGGHNRRLYLLDNNANTLSSIEFDGWVRCSFTIDSNGDGLEEVLVGTGDGDMIILAFSDNKDELRGIFHNKMEGKILCCAAADINMNGVIDYIFGGEGKKIYIFEGFESEDPSFILYYASWVTTCAIGALKLPDSKKLQNYVLVGTQNGILQLIQIENNDLEIIWQVDLVVKLNDIKVGDVFNDGNNEICIACDDSTIKILNSMGKVKKTLKIEEGRPLTLNIDDIDDDNALELIVGGAHGTLSIFQNEVINSTEIKLKWKTSGKTSIQTICTAYNKNSGTKEIIYGGYNKTLRNITDFDWGKKKALKIPERKKVKPPTIKPVQKKGEVPPNLKEVIIALFNKKLYTTLDALTKDLMNLGYSKEKVKATIKDMKEQSSLIKQVPERSLWTLKKDNLDIEMGHKVERTEGEKDKLGKDEGEIGKVIINFLKKEQPINSKSDFVDAISDLGFDQEKVSEAIDVLNDKNIITYSRSAPQGWKLVP